jgi:hypothetical protein
LSFQRDRAAYGTLTVDIGMGGARFSALRRVATDEPVLVHLQLPSVNIECKGKVCWSSPDPNGLHSFGVRFLDLSEIERDHLQRFIGQATQALAGAVH